MARKKEAAQTRHHPEWEANETRQFTLEWKRRLGRGDSLLLAQTGHHPSGLNDGKSELQSFLILDGGTAAKQRRRGSTSTKLRTNAFRDPLADKAAKKRYKVAVSSPSSLKTSRRRADEVRSIDLDLIAVLGAHLVERNLSLVEMIRVLYSSETNRDSRGVAVRANGEARR